MKPPPFEYHAPSSLQEAVQLLSDLEDEDAKCLAGGQSLVPLMNLRLARPGCLVDLNGITELRGVDRANACWRIGALTRHADIEDSAPLRQDMPLLPEVARHIGYRAIRNRGTFGGAIAHGDPVAEWPAVARALNARMEIVGPSGTRHVDAEAFFVSFFMPDLEPDEVLRAVEFDVPTGDWSWGFSELARKVGDYAIVSATVIVELDDGVRSARVALSGVGATPVRASSAEASLQGAGIADASSWQRAADVASEEVDPTSDLHGSAGYRRTVVRAEVRRALEAAARRATEGH